jgi:DNA-binding transcriptional ArsR family regulator
MNVVQARLTRMELHHPERSEIELPPVLHALSDPQRLEIVRKLADSPKACSCGSIKLGVAKSTMTHHYRVLRESGVIHQQRIGTTKMTELRREDLDARFPGLLDAVLASEPVPA